MLTYDDVIETLPRPTGDSSTQCRSYNVFYNFPRYRTKNYPDERYKAIRVLGVAIEQLIKVQYENAPNIQEYANIDIIASEFCKIHNLTSSLEIMYAQIVNNFKKLQKLEADYFKDQEIPDQEGIVFKIIVKNKPKKILQDEKNFYQTIRNLIPAKDRNYFSLVYTVV